MELIETGNFDVDVNNNPNRRGWVLGHFIDPTTLLFSNEIEIKWGIHQKGEK